MRGTVNTSEHGYPRCQFSLFVWVLFVLNSTFLIAGDIPEIQVQQLVMQPVSTDLVQTENLLDNEVADVDLQHVTLTGPVRHAVIQSSAYDVFYLFVKGQGRLELGKQTYQIVPESIAFPVALTNFSIQVSSGDTLHFIVVRKKLSEADLETIKNFPAANRTTVYFKTFQECAAYTEKIKSPNTVSRTVLPKDFAPRVAMGTVETKGPDAVGGHEHAMLDQLFLGLAGNEVTVHADDQKVIFKEFELLHIPLGSRHWVEAAAGKKMYYLWMDFFLTKEGEVWLKTHKAIDKKKLKNP